jgi:type IV secretion system protein VirD4
MKSVNQTSTVPTIPHLPKLPKLDPSLLPIGGLVILWIILHNIRHRVGKKAKTATARWAHDRELKRCRQMGKTAIAKPQFNKAAYYITEPVGTLPVSPQQAARGTNIKVYLPQINRGMLVVGGAGSGKTANAIDPAILSALRQGFSLALYDFKFGTGGQSELIIPYALSQGYQVRILAPGFDISQTCNLLDRLKDDKDLAGARELVEVISENTGESDTKKDNFFDPAGNAVLSGAFLMAKWVAIKENNPDLANILMVNQILSLSNLSLRLIAAKDDIEPWVYSAFSVLTGSSSSDGKNVTEAGILANAVKTLAPLVLPNFLPAFCGTSTFPHFDPQDPLKVDGKQLVVFGVDKDNRASTIPLVATAMQQIISHNLKPGRAQPLVIALDEFPTLSLKVVLNWLNEERFNGASIIVGVQYLGQIIARYGKDWSDGFLASCATKIWFNPGEDSTAQYISKSLGEEELSIVNDSRTYNFNTGGSKNGSDGSRSVNDQLHKKALIEAHAVRQFPQGACVIESPGVGTKGVAGVPFQHRFSFSERESGAVRDKSAREFARVRELIVEGQGGEARVDYSYKLAEYNQILERLLPLPESQAEAMGKEPLHLLGSKISTHFSGLGYDISEFAIEPARRYYIPPTLIKGGKFSIEIQDLPQVLAFNHPVEEFEQKLAHYHTILAKLLSPAPKQLDLASPEPANISGKRLSEHFSGLGHTLSEFTIEPARKYYIPPELMNGQNFAIEIEDLSQLLAYNHPIT